VFSRRSSRDLSLNAIAVALSRGVRPRYDLTSSNPTSAFIPYPTELAEVLERAQSRSLRYTPHALGLPSARAALAAAVAADPDDILLTASTSEAYSFLFKLLCDPGDRVLVPAPSYPLFEHLAELEGVGAVSYRLAYDGAWHIDFDSVHRALGPLVRAIVVVSPNNPTGHYLLESERAKLEALGLPLIVDEVFAPFPLRARVPEKRAESSVLTFALDGLSKRAGLPQLKLAWTALHGPEAARRQARERLELISDTFLSVGTPVQEALPDLLGLAPTIAGRIGARCGENLASLEQILRDSPVSVLRAEAGWSAVLQLPRVQTEEQLVLGLLEQAGVLVQPGWFYDFEAEPFAVVSLLGEPQAFAEGVSQLARYVSRL